MQGSIPQMKKIIKIIIEFIVSFMLLLFVGTLSHTFLSLLPEDLGPFLKIPIRIIEILMPDPNDAFGLVKTTLWSILIIFLKEFEFTKIKFNKMR